MESVSDIVYPQGSFSCSPQSADLHTKIIEQIIDWIKNNQNNLNQINLSELELLFEFLINKLPKHILKDISQNQYKTYLEESNKELEKYFTIVKDIYSWQKDKLNEYNVILFSAYEVLFTYLSRNASLALVSNTHLNIEPVVKFKNNLVVALQYFSKFCIVKFTSIEPTQLMPLQLKVKRYNGFPVSPWAKEDDRIWNKSEPERFLCQWSELIEAMQRWLCHQNHSQRDKMKIFEALGDIYAVMNRLDECIIKPYDSYKKYGEFYQMAYNLTKVSTNNLDEINEDEMRIAEKMMYPDRLFNKVKDEQEQNESSFILRL